jgi:hypothetical protein
MGARFISALFQRQSVVVITWVHPTWWEQRREMRAYSGVEKMIFYGNRSKPVADRSEARNCAALKATRPKVMLKRPG